MVMQLPVLAFFLLRVYDFVVAYFAPFFLKYGGNFSHPAVLKLFNLPAFIESFANFDGLFYIRIASQGYEQFEQAFFPLYPLLMSSFSNKLIGGLLISNLSFLIGLFVFRNYLSLILKDKKQIFWTIIFLLVFPTSFFFGSLYTEGLFFLLVVSAFYYLKKENWLLVSLFGFLAATTRFVGVFLIVPIGLYYFLSRKKLNLKTLQLTALVAPLVGLGSYCFYLWRTFGSPFLFFTSQEAFSAGRSTKLILLPQVYFRYLKIFLLSEKNFGYLISALEFSVFTIVLLATGWFLFKKWKAKNWDLTILTFFSLINLLVPTLTGTFLSIPRFALLSLAFFIALSEIKSSRVKLMIALLFVLVHTVLLAYFIQGYFVS